MFDEDWSVVVLWSFSYEFKEKEFLINFNENLVKKLIQLPKLNRGRINLIFNCILCQLHTLISLSEWF